MHFGLEVVTTIGVVVIEMLMNLDTKIIWYDFAIQTMVTYDSESKCRTRTITDGPR